MNPFEVPMSPRNPPCSETVAPVQKHSLPVSNKTEMHETNRTEGQLFEKRVQKVCSNPELREGGGLHFKLAFHFLFLSFQLEEEFYQQIVENGVAGTISQEFKEKLRKVTT